MVYLIILALFSLVYWYIIPNNNGIPIISSFFTCAHLLKIADDGFKLHCSSFLLGNLYHFFGGNPYDNNIVMLWVSQIA